MDNMQQLIEQARALLHCPACGRHFESKEISFKGFMEHAFVLQATCNNQHQTIFTTWITSFSDNIQQEVAPIESDHVLALHEALKQFDGNFQGLWSKKGT